jgi:hypothetical protein
MSGPEEILERAKEPEHPDRCPNKYVVEGRLWDCGACFCNRCVAKMAPEQLMMLENNICPFCGKSLMKD